MAFYLTVYLTYILTFFLAFYLTYILTWYLAYILTFYLAFYLTYILTFYPAFYLALYLAFYLANILAFYLAFLLASYLAFYLAYILPFYLAFYLAVEVRQCPLGLGSLRLRSSGAHWTWEFDYGRSSEHAPHKNNDGPSTSFSGWGWSLLISRLVIPQNVPGWGPAVPTGLERSPVEVQRCPLDLRGPRLRSSGAHWTWEVTGWGPAVPTDIRRWLFRSSGTHWDRELAVEVQQCPLRSGAENKKKKEARRAILKSNNPYPAGGEKTFILG